MYNIDDNKSKRRKDISTGVPVIESCTLTVPRRLFFAAQQRIAITWSPKYYQKMRRSITRENQKEYGPDVK
jgi:hypothetical protein